jgi:glycosyltransferase involved in cell wall biosynthesis
MSVELAVIIPTLDEELHIERAIASATELGPVYVIDCGSSDGTEELALQAGAAVYKHPWEGYAAQKNWALKSLPITTPWVLFLDADEMITPAGRREIESVITEGAFEGFYVPRQNIFLGRVLKHAWWYPDYTLRLFRREKGRFEARLVHESVLLDGRAGFLKEALLHENLKGIDAFIWRHLRYATLEAEEMHKWRNGVVHDQRRGSLVGSWPERRRALKTRVWYRLPGRPAIRFFWMYFIKRGFLDGQQGLIYSQLLAAHEALIDAKLLERQLSGRSGQSQSSSPSRRYLERLACLGIADGRHRRGKR